MKKYPEEILVILGGPRRNRTTETRIFNPHSNDRNWLL